MYLGVHQEVSKKTKSEVPQSELEKVKFEYEVIKQKFGT